MNEDSLVPLLLGQIVVSLVFYVYGALCLQKMAQKTNSTPAWLAWIPVANIFLFLQVAGRPLWWFVLLLIPFVNLVISIILLLDLAKRMGKPAAVGLLMLIPLVNLVVLGWLAFSSSAPSAPVAAA